MVSATTIIAALILSILMVLYLAAVLVGWLAVVPTAVLLGTYLADYYKGTSYTSKVIAFGKRFTPEKATEKICLICGPDSETLPEDYNYCYCCGKSLS